MTEVEDYVFICQSYIDDDTFPQQMSVLTVPPPCAQQILRPSVVCSSHGLECLYGIHPNFEADITLIWNPSIRKFIRVDVPGKGEPSIGFGVCPVTNDPKIVSITQSSWNEPEINYRCEVMVYTLSSGKWKSLSTNLPTKRIWDPFCSVVTDGFIYWRAESRTHNFIMSFNVSDESFEVIDLPDTLARHDPYRLHISKLRESTAIIEYTGDICTVWMMEHGVQRSFTKLFIIERPQEFIVGFNKSGIPIMKVTNYDDDEPFKLVVYEPNSEHNNVIGFAGSTLSLNMTATLQFGRIWRRTQQSYTETLLLLGRSDCSSY